MYKYNFAYVCRFVGISLHSQHSCFNGFFLSYLLGHLSVFYAI